MLSEQPPITTSSPKELPQLTILWVSLFLGFLYSIITYGSSLILISAQMTIFTPVFIGVLMYLKAKKERGYSYYVIFLISSAGLLSLYQSITSNIDIALLSWVTLHLVISLLVLDYYGVEHSTLTVSNFLRLFSSYLNNVFKTLTSKTTLTKIWHAIKPFVAFNRLPTIKLEGIGISIILLIVVNYLFMSINTEYAHFITAIGRVINFERLISFLTGRLVLGVGFGYGFFCLFQPQPILTATKQPQPLNSNGAIRLVLISMVFAFLLFIGFQLKLIFVDTTTMDFETLSQYVKAGFKELLVLSLIGYVLITIGVNTHWLKLNRLLVIFTSELILIVLFAYHKLIKLQWLFGFKDLRVLATVATTLIGATLVLHYALYKNAFFKNKLFLIQLGMLVSSVVVLNIINLDGLITKHNPPSYYVAGVKYPDYSYIFTNSEDNYNQWLALSSKIEYTSIILPPDYSSNSYQALCHTKVAFPYRVTLGTHMQKTLNTISNVYSKNFFSIHLKDLGIYSNQNPDERNTRTLGYKLETFNLRHYMLYKDYIAHKIEYQKLIKTLDVACLR